MRRAVAAVVGALMVGVLMMSCLPGDREQWAGQAPERLTLATGGTTGIYFGYGSALADVLAEQHGIQTAVLSTGGSVDNLQLLAGGGADVAFSAADAVADAVAGEGFFEEPVPVQALARVYDDFAHLVVPADSSIEGVEDLRGKRVSVGAARSGTSLIAGRVLAAAGVDQRGMTTFELGIDESLSGMRAGTLDAFFWSGGLRTPGVVALSGEMDIRLVPLGDVVDKLRETYGNGYRHGVIPEGVYGVSADVDTLAVPNLLVVRADMQEGVAGGIVATLFDAQSELTANVPSAAILDRARAIYTDPADLHVGALDYYRDTKD